MTEENETATQANAGDKEPAEDSTKDGAEAAGGEKKTPAKTGKKRKSDAAEEPMPKRERSTRGAKTKAALQILQTSLKETNFAAEPPELDYSSGSSKKSPNKKGGAEQNGDVSDDEASSNDKAEKNGGTASSSSSKSKSKKGSGKQKDKDQDKQTNNGDQNNASSAKSTYPARNSKRVVINSSKQQNKDGSGSGSGSGTPTAASLSSSNIVAGSDGSNSIGGYSLNHPFLASLTQNCDKSVLPNLLPLNTNVPPEKPKPVHDPNKPPPITSYMKVRLEELMNCLEKMFHNHLPTNAFTARYPNARTKAMLTLMLDAHRAGCEECDRVLDEANMGKFHSDSDRMDGGLDLSEYGPVVPTQGPSVDLSQYPDNIAAMKKLLVEKDAKIKALEKRLEVANKDCQADDVDKLDLVSMLDGVGEPTLDKFGGKFLKTAGYRIIDLRLLRMGLEICQTCTHNKMTIAEMTPEVEGNQEDLVTRLAFVCGVCGPKAIFPTSPFSKAFPSNYSLNKLLLPLIGPTAYFHLSSFLQHNPDPPLEVSSGMYYQNSSDSKKPQLLVSLDHAYFDFARPFDPPLPEDPDANIMAGAPITVPSSESAQKPSDVLKMKPFNDIRGPPAPSSNSSPSASGTASPILGEQNGIGTASAPKKIKSCPELPPGCRITSILPGTNLVSQHVKYSTTQRTGLTAGAYRVKEPHKSNERILVVRDENNPNDQNAVQVTELEKNSSRIDVRDPAASNSNSSSSSNVPSRPIVVQRPQPSSTIKDSNNTPVNNSSSSKSSGKNSKNKKGSGSKRKSTTTEDEEEEEEEDSDIQEVSSDDDYVPRVSKKKSNKSSESGGGSAASSKNKRKSSAPRKAW